MWGYSQDGGKIVSLFYQLESPRPPHTPRLPGDWDPGARQEPRTTVRRPAPVGATPVADQPIEPLRGELQVVTSAVAESDKFKPGLDR